jgi:hypothetical protein
MGNNVLGHFIQQWLHDTDCFIGLHDRKVRALLPSWGWGGGCTGLLIFIHSLMLIRIQLLL